jgi:hypothetical protein
MKRKFYVQSGNLKLIILGEEPLDAAVNAVIAHGKITGDESLKVAALFFLNEHRFLKDGEHEEPEGVLRPFELFCIPSEEVHNAWVDRHEGGAV